MLVLVSYDVSTTSAEGRRRLRRVAKACLNYGQRVQNSVFECPVDPAQWAELRHRLLDEYNPEEDSLRFYYLGSNSLAYYLGRDRDDFILQVGDNNPDQLDRLIERGESAVVVAWPHFTEKFDGQVRALDWTVLSGPPRFGKDVAVATLRAGSITRRSNGNGE